jgi:hypothetical protein
VDYNDSSRAYPMSGTYLNVCRVYVLLAARRRRHQITTTKRILQLLMGRRLQKRDLSSVPSARTTHPPTFP